MIGSRYVLLYKKIINRIGIFTETTDLQLNLS